MEKSQKLNHPQNIIMIRIVVTLFLLTGFFPGAYAQSTLSEEVTSNIKARIDQGINPGIVVGIIDAEGPRYYSFGVKSLKTKEPVNEHSVFEIGSISKTFTGILLADMVTKGEVKLDDPLQKYLPAGVTAPTKDGASIKLVHLANHTSSLPRMPDNFKPANPANPFADYSEKQLYDLLNNYKLTREIGSEYEYSNYAAGLLGHILAAKKGVSYEKLMIDVIAKPLDLNDTRIAFTPKMKANLAMGHSNGVEVENWDIATLEGAGAIRSTAVDMLKYLNANMGKVKSKLYPALQLSHKDTRPEGSKPMVGLGWHKESSEEPIIIWHNGGTGGYKSFIGFTKGGDKGVVVLTNSSASVDDLGMHLLDPKSPLKAMKAPEATKDIVVDEKTLDTYVGQYELAPTFMLTVSRDGEQLKVQATGQEKFPVYAKAPNIFYYKVVEAQLTFNQGDDGKVKSVTLHQGGRQTTGKKLEK